MATDREDTTMNDDRQPCPDECGGRVVLTPAGATGGPAFATTAYCSRGCGWEA